MRKSRNKNWINILCIILAIGFLGIFLNFNKIKKNWGWITMKPRQELNVPLEKQLPDLPNGCEVTSLSMLLNYYHINVSKDKLAQNIKHVSSFTDDGQYRGNPHEGFVGYMSVANAGWCVYNEPLYNVAHKYTDRIQNTTGSSFTHILSLVSSGHPVMIITTLHFNKVNDMQTWKTKQGNVHVTPSSHACVITGYDKKKRLVYVNDPYGVKNRAVSWNIISKPVTTSKDVKPCISTKKDQEQ